MNNLLEQSLKVNPDIIIWPEAALTSFLAVSNSKKRIEIQKRHNNSALITGIPQRVYLND